ncbi:MAG: glycosyltransferase [Roseiarcus sp.]
MLKVTVVTPTYNRERFHTSILNCVRSQDYSNLEWIVLDDSPSRSELLATSDYNQLKYIYIEGKLTVGEKRNLLLSHATGDIIVHFDDDDFYAPNYVSQIVASMEAESIDLLNFRGFFVLDLRRKFFGYWNTAKKSGLHYRLDPTGINLVTFKGIEMIDNHLGWGFAFSYRKKVADSIKFLHVNWNSDCEFALQASKVFRTGGLFDNKGLCLHVVHHDNVSVCYAQSMIPNFLVRKVFPRFTIPELDSLNLEDEVSVAKDNSRFVSNELTTSRNALCYCGSGKKYKHCHGSIS